MKTFKNIALIFALMAMLPLQVLAQKPEKIKICRDEECVVEILKKLNSQKPTVAAEAKKDIELVVESTRITGDSDAQVTLRKSMMQYIEKADNYEIDKYLISLMPKFCSNKDAAEILQLADNDRFADYAIRAVADIPKTGDYIEKYVIKHHDNISHKAALAYAIGKQNIKSMENDLVSWLKGADDDTKIAIYDALIVVGSSEKTAKIVEKGAKKLYKSSNVDYKVEGMKLLVAVKGEKALPTLYKALKSNDDYIRTSALDLMKPYADEKVCAKAVKICSKGDAVVDVLNWLGEIKNDSQMEFVISQLSSENPKVVNGAIRAVFNIDNPDGIAAVKPMFGGQYQKVIKDEMVKYEGDYFSVLNDVIRGNDQQKLAALQIIEARPILETNRRVTELLNSSNKDVRDEAYVVLKYVVMPANAEYLSFILDRCDEEYVDDVQLALKNAMANATDSAKDKFASTLKHIKPEKMPRYYKVFAYFGTEFTINKLVEAYNSGEYKEEAKEALLLVDNDKYSELIKNTLK